MRYALICINLLRYLVFVIQPKRVVILPAAWVFRATFPTKFLMAWFPKVVVGNLARLYFFLEYTIIVYAVPVLIIDLILYGGSFTHELFTDMWGSFMTPESEVDKAIRQLRDEMSHFDTSLLEVHERTFIPGAAQQADSPIELPTEPGRTNAQTFAYGFVVAFALLTIPMFVAIYTGGL